MPGELRFGMTFRRGSDRPSIVEHVERYEARYLSKALEFVQRHQAAYPFDKLVDAEFGLADVKQALDASAQRIVTRAAVCM